MTNEFIMQMKPWFGLEEKKAITEYMDEDGFLTEFKHTTEFENMIARYTGAKHCIVVNNGTISLMMAGLACGLKAGDEVIVPNYTMVATPNSVKLFGANPVFVDVEEQTLCLDLEKVREAITPRTKAIIFVSANGRYPDQGIENFTELCNERGILLIEDAAQSLGSFYPDGVHIGRKGLVGSFSFSAPKIISTGQGGCLITDDDLIASQLRTLKDFGRASGGGSDIHETIGYNFKFTEMQAVIGIAQMRKLEWRVKRKKQIYALYSECLENTAQIRLFGHNLEFTSPWFIDSLAVDRENLMSYLKGKNIGTRLMYPPINKQKAYSLPGYYPVADSVGESGLWLPSMSQLTDQEIHFICDEIKSFYR